MSNGKSETAGLDFLDFIFTVAISVGLTPEVLQIQGVTGLLSEKWVQLGQWPSKDELFNLLVFFLGFLTLTLSWFGYHASIISRPLKYNSGFGMVRFIMDVLLVIIYGIILLHYKSFGAVLTLIIIIHFLFVIWDYLKIKEYKSEFQSKTGGKLKRYRREWVSLVCFILFFVLGVAFLNDLHRWLSLCLAILITVFYRVNKIYPTWERAFGVNS